MAIFSNTQKSFKTNAGVLYKYQEQFGVTPKGEFYFVIPDNTAFNNAISLLNLKTGRLPRSTKDVVFASTYENLTKAVSSIIGKISEVIVEEETFIFYKNGGNYSFYRNSHTGDIGPSFFPELYCERFDANQGFNYKTGYSISLQAVVLTEKMYKDAENNKKMRYEKTADSELGLFGKRLNAYASRCDLDNSIRNGLLGDYKKLPYTEANAEFFTRFFDTICRFNYEILQKLEPEVLQNIIASNILLIDACGER
ncbi:hypothetical protein [Phascolarctobacterium faecium]|uniref:hypothetical protein n=1 Tax=Phascolarctobacterium faecium TaxID=33025 RepID=UPI0039966A78